jgi:hexulose-6-phosphate isomerase
MWTKSLNQWTVAGFEGAVPVLEAARVSKTAGFEAVELAFGAGELSPATTVDDLRRIRDGLADLGLQLSSLATGYYWTRSLSSPDPVEREEALEFTRAYLKAAALLGTDAVLVLPGSVSVPFDPNRPVVPAQQAYLIATESIRSLIPVAEETGVTLCVENVWNRFLTGPFEYCGFIGQFDSPLVKAYFDVGNVLLFGYPEHWIEILGSRIGRVHLKNFARSEGAGTLSGFTSSLFDGDLNWEAVFKALRTTGYQGYLTAEMLVSEKGLPDNDLARDVASEMAELLNRFG